jgi:hypothetical protein
LNIELDSCNPDINAKQEFKDGKTSYGFNIVTITEVIGLVVKPHTTKVLHNIEHIHQYTYSE